MLDMPRTPRGADVERVGDDRPAASFARERSGSRIDVHDFAVPPVELGRGRRRERMRKWPARREGDAASAPPPQVSTCPTEPGAAPRTLLTRRVGVLASAGAARP